MDYKSKTGSSAQAGRYSFKIDQFEDNQTFSTGSTGVKATLLVNTGEQPEKVYARFVDTPGGAARLARFMESVGLDFGNIHELEPVDFVGLSGEAEFIIGDRGYLEAVKYLPAGVSMSPAPRKSAVDDRDVTF